MASIRRIPQGPSWQAIVRRRGYPLWTSILHIRFNK